MDKKGKVIFLFKQGNGESFPNLDDLKLIPPVEKVEKEVPEVLRMEKIQAKAAFIEKAKYLASRARFDIEIWESEECITVIYEFPMAFLLPGIYKLFVEVLQMCDDSLIFPAPETPEKVSINLFYRLTD